MNNPQGGEEDYIRRMLPRLSLTVNLALLGFMTAERAQVIARVLPSFPLQTTFAIDEPNMSRPFNAQDQETTLHMLRAIRDHPNICNLDWMGMTSGAAIPGLIAQVFLPAGLETLCICSEELSFTNPALFCQIVKIPTKRFKVGFGSSQQSYTPVFNAMREGLRDLEQEGRPLPKISIEYRSDGINIKHIIRHVTAFGGYCDKLWIWSSYAREWQDIVGVWQLPGVTKLEWVTNPFRFPIRGNSLPLPIPPMCGQP